MPNTQHLAISAEGIGHTLSDNRLAVPTYQRGYSWEESHVQDFLDDVQRAIDESEATYFLGSIVIAARPKGRPEVVDGQQRLATVSIVLSAIRNYFFQHGESERVIGLQERYLMKRDLWSQDTLPQLMLNEDDREFFTRTVLLPPDDEARKVSPSRESHKRIAAAMKIVATHIERIASAHPHPAERLIDWVEYLDSRAQVTLVRVPNESNAFVIFETLNDRGLALAISDLLKVLLFRQAETRIDEAKSNWIAMFSTLEASDNEEIIIDYIRHLWSSKYGSTRKKNLFDSIGQHITSKQKAIDFSSELSQSAKLYAAIGNTNHELWTHYGPSTREHMQIINQVLRMIQIRPLLLAVLKKFSVTEVKKAVRLMVAWSVRFLIVGGTGGGTLERYYSDSATEVTNSRIRTASQLLRTMKKVVPGDAQFESSFATATVSKSYLARYYLCVLENEASGENEPELIPNPNQEIVNLEHVMPLAPSETWKDLPEDEVKLYSKRIGNMALLAASTNVSLGNKAFADKVKTYKASKFLLTQEISSYKTWDQTSIRERQEKLAKRAVEAWPNKI